jgi:hypothetical protein
MSDLPPPVVSRSDTTRPKKVKVQTKQLNSPPWPHLRVVTLKNPESPIGQFFLKKKEKRVNTALNRIGQ